MQFYFLAWKRAFDFSGCETRKAFWLFMLIHILITLGLIVLDVSTNINTWFELTYSILSFIPMLSAIARRLHGTGKRGYWGLIFCVPVIGPIWLIFLLAQPSSRHQSKEQTL
ncbi:DUF805 domain-containing protein [Vibrio sp. WJH972]